ncbi:MAG: IclR family transcriptional regulator [Eubacteriales bacterium]
MKKTTELTNEMMEESKNPIQVADRLFLVLETLAAEGEMGLQELSSKLQLNKSTVHRILNSLIYMGYVRQDSSSKYRLSFKIWEVANQLLKRTDIVEIARPFIKELVTNIEETVHLVQLDGIQCIYIDKVESYTNTIRMASNVGKSIPLYCSGVGKALLAYMDDAKIKSIWEQSNITQHTAHTITNFADFMQEINLVRELGYALDNEENEKGVRCMAVALSTQHGTPRYAFSISAPINRMSDQRLLDLSPYVLETKRHIQDYL